MLRAAPFRPFSVVLISEKSYHIPHPDFAFLNPSGQVLIVAKAENSSFDILDVPLIARIEVPAEPRRKR
ncbi:MAG: hypothetical protein B9S33_13030 [Pedosphaera sp. Tous-C6FEB]|nr:MAG: hypothetical protein B9S33_13030 [Pedosphaera sp. Tous-C6FEB]